MKQWKLILVTLLAVLMVCVCTSAMAEDHNCEAGFTDIKSATCKQPASSTYRVCVDANCPLGNYEKADVITGELNPNVHRNKKTIDKVAATCTTDGREAYTYCADCWIVLEGGETIPAAHTWAEDKSLREDADCENAGRKYFYCKNCTETKNEPIPATGHTVKYDKHVDPTCGTEGYDVYVCKCGYEEKLNKVPATGKHTEVAWGVRKEATCSAKGIFVYGCSVCEKEVRTEAIKKNPDKHTAPKYAEKKWETCTEDGYEAYSYCEDCGWKSNEYKVIPAPGHSYKTVDWKVKPNCSTVGIMYERCEWCNDLIEVEKATAPNTHTPITVPAKNNSCTEDGYNTYDKCKDCGVILSNNGVLPVTKAYGHKFVNASIKKEATCVETGILVQICERCKKVEQEVEIPVDADAHKTKNVEKKWETCLEDGHEAYTICELCNKKWGGAVRPAPGHNWTNNKELKPATCTEEGVMRQRCTYCDALQEVAIKKLPHKETLDYNLSYAATCTEDGLNFWVCTTCDEYTREEVLPKAEHTMRVYEIVPPTCETDGFELWICTNGCGYEEERRTVEALGHDWETVRVQKPTCTKEGYTQQYCAQCKEYQNIEKTQKIAHKFTVKDATKAPTCESEGFTWYYCEYKCGERTKLDIKSATGHNYVLVKNQEPTCSAEGLQYFECYNKDCEKPYKSETVAKVPHNYAESKWQVIVAPNCTETGRKMNVCTMCKGAAKYEDLPATGHTYGDPIAYTGKAPTCTKDGEGAKYCKDCQHMVTVTIPALNCKNAKTSTVIEPTCTSQGMSKTYCPDCKKTTYGLIAAKGHGKMVEVSKTEPTCTKAGEIVTKCEVCGANEVEVLAATGHQHTKEEIVKAPTCTEAGSNNVVCTDCNTVIETKEVAAKGHGATKEIADKAATCTEAGSINVICTVCGDVLETKEVAALGHGTTKEEAVKAATCTEAGSINVICTVCGETLETKEVAALGHELDEGVVTAPTCTEDGYTTYACTRCDYTEVKDETKATGHVDTKEVETLAPTCTEAGNIDVVCACGEVVESKAVEALGHDMVAGEVTAPTCTEKGYTTYECSRCDATEIKDETEALGHTYEWVMDAVVASPAAPGENWYQCSVCEDIADIEYVKYTKYYYENTLTSFGPTTEELLGEGDWYRVTPIDLSVDGIYTFDLIASNAYVVGTVTITVSEGVMTVSYDVNANHIEVLEEALVLYASKADLAEGKGVTVAFGEEINLAETFGEDSKVLVSLMLIGTYDAAGYGVYGFEADAEEIAELLAIVD